MKQHIQRVGRRVLLLSLAIGAYSLAVNAQQQSLKGLVVFARFAADSVALGGVTRASAEWNDPTRLPLFADHLLAPSPVPPFADSTLTAYFHNQSLGQFTIFGNAHSSVVALNDEASYLKPGGLNLSRADITKDILEVLEADPSFDFGDYDADGDGHLDHLFVVVHRSSFVLCEGGAGVAELGKVDSVRRFGSGSGVIVDQGSYLRYDSAGIIIPNKDLVRLMAHELGHYLWGDETPLYGDHPMPVLSDLPTSGNTHVGYELMAGGSLYMHLSDMRGDWTISAPERQMLGWITCRQVSERETVILGDLYSRGDCIRLAIPAGNGYIFDLFTVNRQRIGYFDRLTRNGFNGSDHGLMTTGLLVQVAYWNAISTVPADGDLAASSYSPDYEGDLFGPDTKTQLTPWTRPGINGRNVYPAGRVLSDDGFQAIDDIRYSGGAEREMAFDYIPDFRQSPTIRVNSWIGDESRGQRLTGYASVVADTLTVTTQIEFSDTLVVASGSTLVIEEGGELTVAGHLRVEAGARVVVRGILNLNGTTDVHPGSIESEMSGLLHSVDVGTESDTFLDVVEISAYPNPFASEVHIEADASSEMHIAIYDLGGRQVGRATGVGRVTWRPASRVANGTYLFRIELGRRATTKTLTLLR